MFRILKIVLLWLVMIALPAQGFAAAVMIDCGDNHQHTIAGNAFMHDHGMHRHADSVSDRHDAGHPPASVAHDDTSANNKLSPTGKCSICADCCLSIVAFASIGMAPMPAAAGLPSTLFPEKRFTVNFPDGLERPPHALSL